MPPRSGLPVTLRIFLIFVKIVVFVIFIGTQQKFVNFVIFAFAFNPGHISTSQPQDFFLGQVSCHFTCGHLRHRHLIPSLKLLL